MHQFGATAWFEFGFIFIYKKGMCWSVLIILLMIDENRNLTIAREEWEPALVLYSPNQEQVGQAGILSVPRLNFPRDW